ncbi:MAG TPA: TolC family protein [Kofleriaceae bacterium]|nr:TolC family protein [Kofleriaceae bacterium]
MTHRLASVVVVSLAAASSARAQPAGKQAPADDMATFEKDLDALFVPGGLTSDGAAARAGNASPSVRRRVAEVQAAIADAEAAELQRVPQISAKLTAERLNSIPPFAISIPQLGVNEIIPFFTHFYDGQVNVNVNLSDYVLRYPKLVDAAHLAEDVARQTRVSAVVSAGEDARLAYYEWVRARLQVLIAKRQLAQVRATLDQERAMFEVQRISKADLLRIESQEADATQTLDQLDNLSRLREEQLRILIGARDEEPLAVGEDIRRELAAPGAARLDDLMARAESTRADFRVLDVGIRAKEKQRDSEKANYFPKLTVFGNVEDANPNPRVFPQSDKFTHSWYVGAGLSWTLNDALVERTNVNRLTAEADELRADRENLVHGTRVEVLAAQQSVQLAVHSLDTSKKGLAAAEEGYRVRKELLAADRATAVELVDAETELTRARIAALNARVDLRVAVTQLAHAIGDDTASAR